MIRIAFVPVLALILACPLKAEAPGQWLGLGVQFNQYASPQINGVMAYAKRVAGQDRPTYSYSAVNFLSVQKDPFRVMTTVETGVAQFLTRFRKIDVFGIGTAGIASSGSGSGTNAGYSASAGLLGITLVKKGVTIGPYYRATKTSLSETQHAVGLMIGIGDR